MRSKFMTLGKDDFIKGLWVAFYTALVAGLYNVFSTHTIQFTLEYFMPVIQVVLLSVTGYLMKNLTTNVNGEILKKD